MREAGSGLRDRPPAWSGARAAWLLPFCSGPLQLTNDVSFHVVDVLDRGGARIPRVVSGDCIHDFGMPRVGDRAPARQPDHPVRVGKEERLDDVRNFQQQAVLRNLRDGVMQFGVQLYELVVAQLGIRRIGDDAPQLGCIRCRRVPRR